MTLDTIEDEWEKDAPIHYEDLGREAIAIPILHAKYLKMFNAAKTKYRRVYSKALDLKGVKTRYYLGELSKEELEERGWDQYRHARPLKDQLRAILEADPDIRTADDKCVYYQIMIDALEEILKSINSRTWNVKTAVEYTKFTNGVL